MSESQQMKADMVVAPSWRELVGLGATLLVVVMVVVGHPPRQSTAAPGLVSDASQGTVPIRLPPVVDGPIQLPEKFLEDLPDTLLPVFRGDCRAVRAPLVSEPRDGGPVRPRVVAEMAESATDSLSTGSPDRLPLVVNEPVKLPEGLPADLPDTSLPAKIGDDPVTTGLPTPQARVIAAERNPPSTMPTRRGGRKAAVPRVRVPSWPTPGGIGRYPLYADFSRGVDDHDSLRVAAPPVRAVVPRVYPVGISDVDRYPLGVGR